MTAWAQLYEFITPFIWPSACSSEISFKNSIIYIFWFEFCIRFEFREHFNNVDINSVENIKQIISTFWWRSIKFNWIPSIHVLFGFCFCFYAFSAWLDRWIFRMNCYAINRLICKPDSNAWPIDPKSFFSSKIILTKNRFRYAKVNLNLINGFLFENAQHIYDRLMLISN